MKKVYTLLASVMALPMAMSAVDFTPEAPADVVYQTCFVQTRTVYDYNDERVTSVGDNGEVQVVGQRISTDNEYRPCGKIMFTLTNLYDGNKKIGNDKMQFRILIQKKGETEEQAQPYTFDAANGYLKWQQEDFEPMVWVKNGFTDAYDFGLSLGENGGPNKYSIYFFGVSDDIEKIGVQSRWERSSTTYESPIAWADPTTPDLTGVLTWEEWKELEAKYATPPDFTPAAPSDVEYLTCFVETRTVRDAAGNVVTSEGDEGVVKVIADRLATGDVYRPCGKINFTINNTYEEGEKQTSIPNANMEYRIMLLREGQAEEDAVPYIFDAEAGYMKWAENNYDPMEWVKNNFTDNNDFVVTFGEGTAPNVHSIYFFGVSEDIAKLGVQSRWTTSGNTYESEITWVEPTTPDTTGAISWTEWEKLDNYWTGVAEIMNDAVSTEYFDLQGRRVANAENGVFIVKSINANGNVKVAKVIR